MVVAFIKIGVFPNITDVFEVGGGSSKLVLGWVGVGLGWVGLVLGWVGVDFGLGLGRTLIIGSLAHR